MVSQEQYPFSAMPVTKESGHLNTLLALLLLVAITGTIAVLLINRLERDRQGNAQEEDN